MTLYSTLHITSTVLYILQVQYSTYCTLHYMHKDDTYWYLRSICSISLTCEVKNSGLLNIYACRSIPSFKSSSIHKKTQQVLCSRTHYYAPGTVRGKTIKPHSSLEGPMKILTTKILTTLSLVVPLYVYTVKCMYHQDLSVYISSFLLLGSADLQVHIP